MGGNHSPDTAITRPIENIYFDDPMPGNYRVRVNLYNQQGGGATQPFRLRILKRGQTDNQSGTVTAGQPNYYYSFTVE